MQIQLEAGSGGKKYPYLFNSKLRSSQITPGSTTVRLFGISIERILFILLKSSIIPPPKIDIGPPDKLVPLPLGITIILFLLAIFKISDISSLFLGKITISGTVFSLNIVPSNA